MIAERTSSDLGWRPTHQQAVLGVFALGLLLRLAIAPYGGHYFDIPTFQFWTYHLVRDPLSEFYHLRQQFLAQPDHLPGDLWVLWGIGQVFRLFSPEMDVQTPGFVWLVKLVPALADVGVAWWLYLLGARLWSRNAGLVAAALVLFNPGVVFLTSIWGQWDSLGPFFALLAVWLYLSGRLGWVLPVLAYATLIEPQSFALLPVLAIAYYCDYIRGDQAGGGPRREGYWADVLTPVGAGAAVSVAVVAVLCLPFGVGFFGIGEWSIIERVRIAGDVYPYATVSAFNLWGALEPPARIVAPDTGSFVLGLSERSIGLALSAIAYAFVLVRYTRDRRPLTLLWAVIAIGFLLYVFPTRIHGRYCFSALVISALPAVADVYYRRIFIVISVMFVMTVPLYYWLQDAPQLITSARESEAYWVLMSIVNLATMAAMLWRLPLERAPTVDSAEPSIAEEQLELSPLPPPA